MNIPSKVCYHTGTSGHYTGCQNCSELNGISIFPPASFTSMLVLFSFRMYEDGMVNIDLISLISITKTDQSLFAVLKFIGESRGTSTDAGINLLADFHRGRNSILLTNFM